jgi:hypothetical protein
MRSENHVANLMTSREVDKKCSLTLLLAEQIAANPNCRSECLALWLVGCSGCELRGSLVGLIVFCAKVKAHFEREVKVMKFYWLPLAFGLFLAGDVIAQVNASSFGAAAGRTGAPVHVIAGNSFVGNRSSFGVTGLPGGRSPLPYPVNPTPANSAIIRNNAWVTYNSSLRKIPTAPNPNRLAATQQLVDPNHFVERPTSAHRYNFQFSDNEVRSVQAALRRMGIYAGQVDGILGPDTQRSIEEYQVQNKRPVTGTPDQWLNASLGIF